MATEHRHDLRGDLRLPRVIHIRVGNLTIGDLHRYPSSVWSDVGRASESCRPVQVYRDRIEAIE